MKKLRLAIIGQGRSGRDIHGAFYRSASNDVIDVTTVVELDPERRERALAEYPGCTVLADYRDLFGCDDIDLVVNDTYSEMHYPITRDLLLHGFNVLVEKPFARTRYECDELIAIAEQKNLTLAVFQQSFYAPIYTATREIIESGKLGDIKQISIRYNGLSRRWDWQTLQMKVAGGLYNTGPHPVGFALGFLDFDDNARVVYSKLDSVLTSGDSDDYAKLIIAAPGRPVVDLEVSNLDAFSDFNLKLQGSRGTYKCTNAKWQMKYIVDGENPDRPVIFESLEDENGLPKYCSEKLVTHEESGDFAGSPFDTAVSLFYHDLYAKITEGREMRVTPTHAAKIVSVIEAAHAENPLPVKFV